MTHDAVVSSELKAFVERWERLEAEKRDVNDTQKEVMLEAKSRGYDVKAMRAIINMRKMDADDLANEEAIIDLYREAIGV
jgi:uncharacterized protein (UPF0335 family)